MLATLTCRPTCGVDMSFVDHKAVIMQKDRHFFVLPRLSHENIAVNQMCWLLNWWIDTVFKWNDSQYYKLFTLNHTSIHMQKNWLVSPWRPSVTCDSVDDIKLICKPFDRCDFFLPTDGPKADWLNLWLLILCMIFVLSLPCCHTLSQSPSSVYPSMRNANNVNKPFKENWGRISLQNVSSED